jgi:hypothetical protein
MAAARRTGQPGHAPGGGSMGTGAPGGTLLPPRGERVGGGGVGAVVGMARLPCHALDREEGMSERGWRENTVIYTSCRGGACFAIRFRQSAGLLNSTLRCVKCTLAAFAQFPGDSLKLTTTPVLMIPHKDRPTPLTNHLIRASWKCAATKLCCSLQRL